MTTIDICLKAYSNDSSTLVFSAIKQKHYLVKHLVTSVDKIHDVVESSKLVFSGEDYFDMFNTSPSFEPAVIKSAKDEMRNLYSVDISELSFRDIHKKMIEQTHQYIKDHYFMLDLLPKNTNPNFPFSFVDPTFVFDYRVIHSTKFQDNYYVSGGKSGLPVGSRNAKQNRTRLPNY